MGILGENDYENLGMMSHSNEMFWHVLWTPDDFDDENVEAWALALYKTDGWVRMRYHSNFTVQPQYLNWVGLNWKFICLSMGSLAERGWAEATSWMWMSTYAVPRMADGHG